MIRLIYLALFSITISIGFMDFSTPPQIASTTCQVLGQSGSGSGILLETGNVLTSAHVVDTNQNGILEDSEKNIKLIFCDPDIKSIDKQTIEGEVVGFEHTMMMDIAIIALKSNNLKSEVKLISDQNYQKLKFGDPVFTIGFQLGMTMHRTDGTVSFPIDPFVERTSITVLPGNSGGGVFNSQNECLGITKASMTEQQQIVIPLPGSGITIARFQKFIPNMSAYVPATKIRAWAKSVGLSDLIDKPIKPANIDPLVYLTVGLIMTFFLYLIRRIYVN